MSRKLLELIVERFVPEGPVIIGIDDTIERRRGKKIAAKGVYTRIVARWLSSRRIIVLTRWSNADW